MRFYKRFVFLLTLFVVIGILIFVRSSAGAGPVGILHKEAGQTPFDNTDTQATLREHLRLSDEVASFRPTDDKAALANEPFTFLAGTPKTPGSNYTKAVVMGQLLSEDTSWLDTADLPGTIQKYIYNTDTSTRPPHSRSPTSLLRLPQPKGHEAMVYLSYIITHYDDLPDVSIFMHAHRRAWHNDEMLNHDAVEMIRRLSAERVTREGYMNLRCHWKPGCPEYIHPHAKEEDPEKLEEGAMKAAWSIMFPDENVPEVLASPCCAQFAVSRERIMSLPVQRYEAFRKWLLDTPLNDAVSGRVFEYLWHKIFTGQSTQCPDMRVCYCDGYGICFEDEKEFDYWFELRWMKREAEKKLEKWRGQVSKYDEIHRKGKGRFRGKVGQDELAGLSVPAVDGDVVLEKEIDRILAQLQEKRDKALKAGTDPRIRAKIAGRKWKDGDGY